MSSATYPPASERYASGIKLNIRAHVPPEPWGPNYHSKRPDAIFVNRHDRVKFALNNPPMDPCPWEKLPPDEQEEETLIIERYIQQKQVGGSTVVVCHLEKDPSVQYIAKIYDGLDYPFLGEPGTDNEDMDCMSRADLDYALEASSYILMETRVGQGHPVVAPRYHDSWTFPLQTHRPGYPRWVRMILLEFVEGEVMQDMITQNKRVRKKKRISVLRRVIEAERHLWWNCLLSFKGSLGPSKVIIRKGGTLAFIGFTSVSLYHYFNRRVHPKHFIEGAPNKAMSPIEQYWPFQPIVEEEFTACGPWRHWLPESWVADVDLFAQWLIKTWAYSDKYQPLPVEWMFQKMFQDKRKPETRELMEKMLKGEPIT
ncbi:hypothetical protein B0T21DRAFT_348607 [Apiosordaria backusii]|uniref:Uncharacterized protein n=1 Tax=Apiosordaria backusii TaxID=314023 RepID=A0AA40BLT4_9PEZI|nr:hypothetical protein B0T21DRAFT_348607 [Apiosordaria backusii]